MMKNTALLLLLLVEFSSSFQGPVVKQSHSSQHGFGMALRMKGNDRANFEKRLEDLLDNDWRVFRAKLVAKEQQDSTFVGGGHSGPIEDDDVGASSSSERNKSDHEKGDLGEMFSHAISHIFPGKQANAKPFKRAAETDDPIFKGDRVGNHQESTPFSSSSSFSHPIMTNIEDPFVTEAELPCYLPSSEHIIDKHRWAHLIPHIEPGCVMVANEKLGGVFHQTVVLMVEHSEEHGSTGIIINR